MKCIFGTAALLAVLLTAGIAGATTDPIEVSQPTQISSSDYYERGNSVLEDSSGDFWLFYARSYDFTGNYGSGNPDNHHYEIYYKKAASIAGLETATPAVVGHMPTTTERIYQGQTTCVEYGGSVWVFGVDKGDGGGQVKAWTTSDGGASWSVNDVLPSGVDPFEGTHMWATVYDDGGGSEIWLVVNRGGNLDVTTYDGSSWSAPHSAVAHEGMPRFFVDGGNLYLMYCSWALPAYYIYQYSAGPTWTLTATITGTDDMDCDPMLTKVGSDYVFIFAPWDGTQQFLSYWTATSVAGFNGLDQTTARMMTAGKYGSTPWVDMWPAAITDGSDVYLFYGSEADGTTDGHGNIFMLELDWTMGNDHFCYVQNAIDAATGTTINVAAGTYREQVKIEDSLTLQGAGIGSSIIEAVDLGNRTTYQITQWSGSAKTIDACIGVEDAGTVAISGFTIDGRQLGPNNFYGIHLFDTDGSVTNCRIEDILDAGTPTNSYVVSLVATHSDGGDFDVNFSSNVIPNFQKGGILLMGPEGNCTLNDNDIDNAPSDYIAGNGIQVSYGCTGSLSGNDVTGIGYTGEDWAATGILLFEPDDVSVSGGTVDQCQTGVNFSQWNWIYTPTSAPTILVDDIELDECDWSVDAHLADDGVALNMTVQNCYIHDGTYAGVEFWGSDQDPWGGGYYGGWTNGTLTASVNNNTISCGDGIVEYIEVADNNTVTLTAHGNDLSGSGDYGIWNNHSANTIDAELNWWGDPAGPTYVPSPRNGSASKPLPAPFPASDEEYPRGGAVPIDTPAGNGGDRAGVNVSPHVDFDPWRTGNIVCTPDPKFLTAANPSGIVTVRYLGGGSGLLYGYSIKFTWTAGIVGTAIGNVTEGSLLSDIGNTQFYVTLTAANEITVDCGLLGALDGAAGPGNLFTVDFTGLGYGTSPVDVTILAVRDKNNVPLSGFYEDDGEIQVDITNPAVSLVGLTNLTLAHTDEYAKNTDNLQLTATVTDDYPLTTADIVANFSTLLMSGGPAVPADSYLGNVATWTTALVNVTLTGDGLKTVTVTATDGLGNSGSDSDQITVDNAKPDAMTGLTAEPGHAKVNLSWNNASGNDTHYDGVVIRYARWNGYATYPGGSEPTYPADENAGDGEAFNGTGASAVHSFGTPDRDIYYYGGFVYDIARNYSDPDAGDGNEDRATNYWLGDVVPTGSWNGLVNTADISALSATYRVSPLTNDECDVGPTDDYSRTGIPEPDGAASFEDLMIFSMNFGVVTPLVQPPYGVPEVPAAGRVGLALESPDELAVGSEFVVSVLLQDNSGIVKGTCFTVDFDPDVLDYLGASQGALILNGSDVFFMPVLVAGLPELSIAVLGDGLTFGHSGELAQLRFRCTGEGPIALQLQDVVARNALNEDLLIHASDVITGSDAIIPTQVYLRGNQPNPFGGATTIAFGLPQDGLVRLAVYDVSGRMVRTLINGTLPAAEHVLSWDRRDDSGHAVSGGVYLYRLETSEKTITRKMVVSN